MPASGVSHRTGGGALALFNTPCEQGKSPAPVIIPGRRRADAPGVQRFVRALSPRRQVRAADPGAEGVGYANVYSTTVKVAEVDAVRPVAMYLAGWRRGLGLVYNLVCFDLDASRGGVGQVREDEARLREQLLAAGIPVVVAASGPSGGRHLWTSCPGGISPGLVARIANSAAALCPSLDSGMLKNPKTGCVRPPGAAHRAGGHSVLTEDDVDTALRVLGRGASVAAFIRLADRLAELAPAQALLGKRLQAGSGGGVPPSIEARGPVLRPIGTDPTGHVYLQVARRALGPSAAKALARQPKPGDDHSAVAHPVLRSLALAGWTLRDVELVVGSRAEAPALEWLRTARAYGGRAPLGEAIAARRLARAWWLAVQDGARMPRWAENGNGSLREVELQVADLLARADAAGVARWTRPSGPSDRMALDVVAYLMLKAGTVDVTVDCRRVGALMGRSGQTGNVSLHRLMDDGWLLETQEGDIEQGIARRVTLATGHECTGNRGHWCAVYERPEGSVLLDGLQLRARLDRVLWRHQADLWHRLGHHAERTLAMVEEAGGRGALWEDLVAQAREGGHRPRTVARHLRELEKLQLVRLGGERIERTEVTLPVAAAAAKCFGHTADLAVKLLVDQAVAAWWAAEAVWSRLDRTTKRRRGPRPGARQEVLAETDPTARAYPRRADKSADHRAAWAIEAERLGGAGLWERAVELQRQGEVVDPVRLLPPRSLETV